MILPRRGQAMKLLIYPITLIGVLVMASLLSNGVPASFIFKTSLGETFTPSGAFLQSLWLKLTPKAALFCTMNTSIKVTPRPTNLPALMCTTWGLGRQSSHLVLQLFLPQAPLSPSWHDNISPTPP